MFDLTEVSKNLAEPARLAVEKLSNGVNRLYEPVHLKRMAQATADQQFIEKISEQDLNRYIESAKNRLIYRHIRQEINISSIADRVAAQLCDLDDVALPEDEWVDEFTDNCKDASSDELRNLWASIYCGELSNPGSIPRRIMRIVSDLDRKSALSFEILISCMLVTGEQRYMLLHFQDWYKHTGISELDLFELRDVGILTSMPTLNSILPSGMIGGIGCIFEVKATQNIPVKILELTSAGLALAEIVKVSFNKQYFENLEEFIKSCKSELLRVHPSHEDSGGTDKQ